MVEIKITNDSWPLDTDISRTPEWEWCSKIFGWINNNKDPNYWQGNIGWFDVTFRFNNHKHATMFALRWSEKVN